MPTCPLILLLAACCLSVFGVQFYVDSRFGDDHNAGTTRGKPWRSIGKVNSA